MREAVAITDGLPGASLGEELGTSVDEDNHNGVSILTEQSSMFETATDTPTGVGPQSFIALPSGFVPNSMSDDEGGMSSDGGVQLNMSSAYSEALNVEMDMVDAEVMGHFNLASIAESYAFVVDEMDDATQLDMVEEESQVVPPSWTLGDDSVAVVPQTLDLSNIPNVMSEVSQQLQYIQDGQEQGELLVAQHGLVHDQSIHSLPSTNSRPLLKYWKPTFQYSIDVHGLCFSHCRKFRRPVTAHGT